MNEINPIELGRQLKKPTGEIGLKVADYMNTVNEQLYDFVLSHLNISNNSKILEIGCGNGKFISKFFDTNSNIHLTAIDFSDVMCTETKVFNKELMNGNKLIVKCEDSIEMSLSDKTFDIVVTINTVYFWEQVERQLNEIKRVLKKDGLFVIGYRPKSVMKDYPSTQEVFNLYEPEDLKLMIQQNGFKIIKEVSQTTNREIKVVDGSQIQQFIDICLIVEKL
jgi:ubiquinone/menaquinone biosynthesis C-methylase UbiE